MSQPPVRLTAAFHEKIWGLPHAGPHAGMKLGEIWFDAGPLLLKFIFTSEKLSVQVHPDDAYAAQHEQARGGRGKTEMWVVMEAEQGARLAVGFSEQAGPPRSQGPKLRQAALDGSIEHMLNWIEIQPGDAVFVPAGTVHALGAGLKLCEIQQQCDITYRLFDYGRDRELHLDRALDVIRHDPRAGRVSLPFACDYFRVAQVYAGQVGPGNLVVLSGHGALKGNRIGPQEVWRLPEPVELKTATGFTGLLVNPT